jgi:small-conductance mechanosensitive channel
MDKHEQLFGLMAIAEEHQAAVRAAVEALASERQVLGEQSAAQSKQLRELTRTANEAVNAMERAASDAVRSAMARCGTESSTAVAGAFDAATRPFLKRLDDSAKRAIEAQSRLDASMARVSWLWICLAGACTGAVLIAVWLMGVVFTEWQRRENMNLTDERDALKAEVTQLRSQSEDWARRAGRAKLETCGSPPRMCVQIDKRTAYGKAGDYFILSGY